MQRRLAPLFRIALGIASVALFAPAASAQSGLQITPDGQQTIVSKDIGGQRWAIARNASDGRITGNVFFPGGGDPQFVWCEQTGATASEIRLDCYGAARCPGPTCPSNAWSFISAVALPASFFQPPGAGPMPTPVPTPPPAARCPTNGPITDLRNDCSDWAYVYASGSVAAALATNGSRMVICMGSTQDDDVLCQRGPVTGATSFTLAEANVNGGPFARLDSGSGGSLSSNGYTLSFTVRIQGESYPFRFSYIETEPLSSAASAAFARSGSIQDAVTALARHATADTADGGTDDALADPDADADADPSVEAPGGSSPSGEGDPAAAASGVAAALRAFSAP